MEALNICITIIASLLPLAYWWRFGDARLDRDYGPYCYTGLFGGYLSNGHRDIKPPLIHGAYWLWMKSFGILVTKKLGLPKALRLLPSLSMMLTILCVSFVMGSWSALILALLLISPSLWPHMANTEWLSITVISMGLILVRAHPIIALFVLGLLPLANQKNLLLVPVLLVLGGLGTTITWVALCGLTVPSIFLAIWVMLSPIRRTWLWSIPKQMGKTRTIRNNIMGTLHLYLPFFYKFALVLTIMDFHSPWFWFLLYVIGLSVAVKQLVPHHFILWALPMALCAKPTPLFWVAWAILWWMQDWPMWRKPSLLYAMTFRFRPGMLRDYGQLLEDSQEVIDWLKVNTQGDEAIWVNGIENHIYIDALRPSVRMSICEAPNDAEFISPRVIVHSATSAGEFNYEGYESKLITPMGLYTIMQRKELKL